MKKTEYESIIFDLIEKQLEREQSFIETLNRIRALLEKQDNDGNAE